MARSFDELIEYLLAETALCGDEGTFEPFKYLSELLAVCSNLQGQPVLTSAGIIDELRVLLPCSSLQFIASLLLWCSGRILNIWSICISAIAKCSIPCNDCL